MTMELDDAGAQRRHVLSVFDFDGTLTRYDSFVPFLKFAFGTREFSRSILRFALPSVRFLARRFNRDELKAQLICTFLTGVDVKWLQDRCAKFCGLFWVQLMRPSGLKSVAVEEEAGVVVTLGSASPALILQPFADRLGSKVIGTELELEDGLLTERMTGNNCRCENKVLRLEALYGSLGQYRLKAWGDTRGDFEFLAAAQEAYWRNFHPAWCRLRLRADRSGNGA